MPPLEAPLIGIDRHRMATDGTASLLSLHFMNVHLDVHIA